MIKNLQNLIFAISPILKFKIDGKSMEPKFKMGEIIFVNRFFYLFKSPKIKDMVALKDPLNNTRYIIKYISKIKQEKYQHHILLIQKKFFSSMLSTIIYYQK